MLTNLSVLCLQASVPGPAQSLATITVPPGMNVYREPIHMRLVSDGDDGDGVRVVREEGKDGDYDGQMPTSVVVVRQPRIATPFPRPGRRRLAGTSRPRGRPTTTGRTRQLPADAEREPVPVSQMLVTMLIMMVRIERMGMGRL
jgi:hypothetical protein